LEIALGTEPIGLATTAAHHGLSATLSVGFAPKSLTTEVAGAWLEIALRTEPARLATTAAHHGLRATLFVGFAPKSLATEVAGTWLEIALGTEPARLAATAAHHRLRATLSVGSASKSPAAEVAGAWLEIALRTETASLATTAAHHGLSLLTARSATELVLSSAVSPRRPSLSTETPEPTPATRHHGPRAAGSASSATESLAAEVAGALLEIALRSKPARLGASAAHHRLILLGAGSATEPILSTAISGIWP